MKEKMKFILLSLDIWNFTKSFTGQSVEMIKKIKCWSSFPIVFASLLWITEAWFYFQPLQ